jgi:hypothetical protein
MVWASAILGEGQGFVAGSVGRVDVDLDREAS